jgi:hypothetical protein
LTNNGSSGNGLTALGGGADSSNGNPGGGGIVGFGGATAGSSSEPTLGGAGVTGTGGFANFSFDEPGPGGSFLGGSYSLDCCSGGTGVEAIGGTGSGVGIVAYAGEFGSVAGVFHGNVEVMGNVSKSGGSFKIDDPVDPANKYLYHSFVESPDMMNIYNGNVVTDGSGTAIVTLPDWFEVLNSDFRYQLTPIGQFAQAMIATPISNGKFTIRTDKGNVMVSWQVTGIRQDAWAQAHRIPVEVEKSDAEKGHYIHPELFGHTGEPNVSEVRHPVSRPRQPAQQ